MNGITGKVQYTRKIQERWQHNEIRRYEGYISENAGRYKKYDLERSCSADKKQTGREHGSGKCQTVRKNGK